jgi:hypothetical protein
LRHIPLEREGLCVDQNGENINVHCREFLEGKGGVGDGISFPEEALSEGPRYAREKREQHFVEGFVIPEISTGVGINQPPDDIARFVCLENDGSGQMDSRGTTQSHLHQPQQGKQFRRWQLRPRHARW